MSYASFSSAIARLSGHAGTFAVVVLLTLGWAVTGPLFRFSDAWQLTMNTISSIVTFLMVFVIQNTQNRQGEALQIKLSELIRATEGARDELMDLEDVEDLNLDQLRARYVELARRARRERPAASD